jgi:hypothetical protein
MQVRCDNQAAIRIAAADGSVSHSRVKHIAVRHHFVRDAAKRGDIEVDWVPTLEQLADVCTKAMDWKLHKTATAHHGTATRSRASPVSIESVEVK